MTPWIWIISSKDAWKMAISDQIWRRMGQNQHKMNRSKCWQWKQTTTTDNVKMDTMPKNSCTNDQRIVVMARGQLHWWLQEYWQKTTSWRSVTLELQIEKQTLELEIYEKKIERKSALEIKNLLKMMTNISL